MLADAYTDALALLARHRDQLDRGSATGCPSSACSSASTSSPRSGPSRLRSASRPGRLHASSRPRAPADAARGDAGPPSRRSRRALRGFREAADASSSGSPQVEHMQSASPALARSRRGRRPYRHKGLACAASRRMSWSHSLIRGTNGYWIPVSRWKSTRATRPLGTLTTRGLSPTPTRRCGVVTVYVPRGSRTS
jgi:hypothetical protein